LNEAVQKMRNSLSETSSLNPLRECLDMARLAVEDCIDTIVATPHSRNGMYVKNSLPVRGIRLPDTDHGHEPDRSARGGVLKGI
jgi:hypothetical protein